MEKFIMNAKQVRNFPRLWSCLIGLSLAVSAYSPASSQNASMPSGLYDCGMLSGRTLMGFGTIEIAGTTYRTVTNRKPGQSRSYSLAANKVILWSGPLDGISSDDVRVVSSVYMEAEALARHGNPFFHVTVQSPNAAFPAQVSTHQISCSCMACAKL